MFRALCFLTYCVRAKSATTLNKMGKGRMTLLDVYAIVKELKKKVVGEYTLFSCISIMVLIADFHI